MTILICIIQVLSTALLLAAVIINGDRIIRVFDGPDIEPEHLHALYGLRHNDSTLSMSDLDADIHNAAAGR